jgi:hypothetical protein
LQGTGETVRAGSVNEMQLLMRELSFGEDDEIVEEDVAAVSSAFSPSFLSLLSTFLTFLSPLPPSQRTANPLPTTPPSPSP